MKESRELLDAMDDLLFQITVLKNKIEAFNADASTSAGDKLEYSELLDCLLVVGMHINKHKEIIEQGNLLFSTASSGGNSKERPSHVSILESAQTWRLTILSVVDALSKMSANSTGEVDEEVRQVELEVGVELDIEGARGAVGDDLLDAIASSPKRKKLQQDEESRGSYSSPLDDIKDDRARQKILLKIADGLAKYDNQEEVDDSLDGIYQQDNPPTNNSALMGGLHSGGSQSSPLPGLAELGIAL